MPTETPRAPKPRHGTRGLLLDVQAALSSPATPAWPTRRRALHWLAAAGAAVVVSACGDGSSDSSSPTSGTDSGTGGTTGDTTTGGSSGSSGTTTVGSCSEIPTETEGPYPADGTRMAGPGGSGNGSAVNALTLSGIVRSDIRTSISGAGTTAQGVPVTLKLKLVDSSSGCTALANRAIYVWHCDRDGNYSLYSTGVTELDYLRGVQVSDANGEVTFTTIFPACYSGRWPHIHFEIYSTLTDALDSSRVGDYTKVSQLALPVDVCNAVYNGTAGYSSSVRNLAAVSLATDNVFSDDQAAHQLATVTGSVSEGYTVSLTVGVAG